MKKQKNNFFSIFIMFFLFLFTFTGCKVTENNNDIVILYTNDVHCDIEENIGYAGLASYKSHVKSKTPHVSLVDCGDSIQGDVIGAISKGDYIIDIMNEIGYDIAVLGNHEFDYGMDQLSNLIKRSKAQYIGSNITYSGKGENKLSNLKPYKIINYGKTSVAYIGVTTPKSIASSTPSYFKDESGNIVYDFAGTSAETFYTCVQKYIDECKNKGANYVVLCTHLGDSEEYSPFSSVDLIHNTTNVNVIIDGHAHNEIPSHIEKDKNGNEVILTSSGTDLKNIGQVVITPNGNIYSSLISHYNDKDSNIQNFIGNIKKANEEDMNNVVAYNDTALSCYEDDIRLVRNRETTIGNMCADAYRKISGANIALVNGGGIRDNLPEGDITYEDIIKVHPFGNKLCMVKATGQEILDALELSCRKTLKDYSNGKEAIGENGGFLQVSGIKYTINTSIKSSVVLDETEMFVSVNGPRRVSDVYILSSDETYEPIDKDKTYTIASHDYIIKNSGGGCNMFTDNEFLIDDGIADYQVLIDYIKSLNGNLKMYNQTENRITVK